MRKAGFTSFSSNTVAPRMAGTAIRRLKPTAHDRDNPSPSAIATVRPLRLTPGKGASICARPIRRASSQVISDGPFPPSVRRKQVVTSSAVAVARKPQPVMRRLSNAW